MNQHYSEQARATEWFLSSLGQALLLQEQQYCSKLIPARYYPSCLQVGLPVADFLQEIETHRRFVVQTDKCLISDKSTTAEDNREYEAPCSVIALDSTLPFAEKTHDLIVLPHTLDFCSSPHEVLRQVSQILTPEGCVCIIGFNMLSFYGLMRLFQHHGGKPPWQGQYYSVGRVQDWLSLLGFDLVGAEMMAYQPPLQNERWRSKLAFLDQAGNRWWPGLGGIYIIVGRKKEMAMSSSSSRVTRWRHLLPGIAQPAAQRAARSTLKLVVDNNSD